jgi:hypothetical protein
VERGRGRGRGERGTGRGRGERGTGRGRGESEKGNFRLPKLRLTLTLQICSGIYNRLTVFGDASLSFSSDGESLFEEGVVYWIKPDKAECVPGSGICHSGWCTCWLQVAAMLILVRGTTGAS